MKNCRVCSTELTNENWMPSLKKKNCIICRECNNTKGREWRSKNRSKANQYSLNRYFKNPKKSQEITHKSRIRLRIDTIVAYGGKCSICGISDVDVLDIDHISNNRAEHRRQGFHGYNLYRLLKKQNFPIDNYQVLCKYCNWKKEILRRKKERVGTTNF